MEPHQLLLKTLSNLGIHALNEMQEQAVQTIQAEPNVTLLAPTGSGKTLAFLLPVLNLLQAEKNGVQCLILSPTRELAIQIERVWQKMATGFKVNTCYGGHPMQTEINNLSQPPAVLIGTPGRILEHLTRATFSPDGISILILDEFDKSLSLGFQEQMAEIIKVLPALEKRVLVSATNKMVIPAFTGIVKPKVLNHTRPDENAANLLTVKTIISPDADKSETLFRLLCLLGPESTLIFCNQRDSTEAVRDALAEMGIRSASFHGGMDQPEREQTLVQFRNGSILYLVASDLAARGLDIPDVKNVIHYELPMKNNEFLHRNGRTARMHAEGTAYLILGPDEPLPIYLPNQPEVLPLPATYTLPEPSPWMTLYISGGKKDKLSKMDIVGFLTKKGELVRDDIGKIEVMDFMSFAAVRKTVAGHAVERVKNEKMKGKKYRIVAAK
jgi:superfamily II DNA/RNA helicase